MTANAAKLMGRGSTRQVCVVTNMRMPTQEDIIRQYRMIFDTGVVADVCRTMIMF